MSAAAVSNLSTAPDGPASITVTVRIDLHDERVPPAVLGLLASVRTLAGPDAVTVAGPADQAARAAGPVSVVRPSGPGDPGAAGERSTPAGVRPVDGRLVDGRAADGRAADGRAADGRAMDGRAADGRVADGRSVEPAGGRAPRPRPWLVRPGAEPGSVPSLRIYTASRTVVRAGVPIRLTRREYDLLAFLCEHPRRVFTRRQLMRQVWDHEMVGGERTVDVHVRRLRVKLGERGPLIATVRGIGYRLDEATRVAVVGDPR